jgi:anti-anti-sigma factor
MTSQTIPTGRKRECQLTFRVQRCPYFLLVAIQGEASFDQAEVLSAQLLRLPLDAYWLVVFDLSELTFLSSLAMGALVEYRRGLCRRGVEVRLANVHAPVWLALESASLWTLFQPMELEQPTPVPAVAVAQPCSARAAHAASLRRSRARSESSSGVSG